MLIPIALVLSTAAPAPGPSLDVAHYEVRLRTTPGIPLFDSTTRLRFAQVPDSRAIELDTFHLLIRQVSVGGKRIPHRLKLGERADRLFFTLPKGTPDQPLPEVTVEATGQVFRGGDLGMLVQDDGHGAELMYSMSEPDGARRMFPAHDVPADKATWRIQLDVPVGDTALANGERLSDTLSPTEKGRHVVEFGLDVPTSPYLIAFAIGKLESGSAANSRIPIQAWIHPEERSVATFTAELAHAQMKFLEQELATPYRWPRYDQVAIPEFLWSGMENATLTFLRRSAGFPEGSSSPWREFDYAGLIGHELAHQWFGDDVSPARWRDLWLNEGFATYFGRRAAQSWTGGNGTAIRSAVGLRTGYFRDQNGLRAHALVSNSDDPSETFDSISYSKGAAVLGMLRERLGDTRFQQGIAAYLQAHAHGIATTDDLIADLSRATGDDLTGFANAWIRQSGHPIVQLSRRWNAESHRLTVTLTQSPVSASALAPFPLDFRMVFHRRTAPAFDIEIPVHLAGAKCELDIELPAEAEWVNPDLGARLLTIWRHDLTRTELLRLATLDPDPVRRVLSAGELLGLWGEGSEPLASDAENAALAGLATTDPDLAVRWTLLEAIREAPRTITLDGPWIAAVNAAVEGELPAGSPPRDAAALRFTGTTLLGRVGTAESRKQLEARLQKSGATVDELDAAGLGIAGFADAKAVEALEKAIALHASRGMATRRVLAWSMCSMRFPGVAPALTKTLIDSSSSSELVGRCMQELASNQPVQDSVEGVALAEAIASDDRFSAELRARALKLLDDSKAPTVKASAARLRKTKEPRLRAAAEELWKARFATPTAPRKAKR